MALPEHPATQPDAEDGRRDLHGVFQRLRERKLVQWALAYLAGAWLALQLFGAVRDSFGWSPAAGRVLIVLLVLGLFVTLVLAWYHGEQGHQRVSGPELLMLAALLVIAGGVMWQVGRGGARPAPAASASAAAAAAAGGALPSLGPPPAAGRAVAVLPFANLSESRENEYFSDGITEDILTNLSRVSGLRVISRTSAMAYRGSNKALRQIGRELGVSHVVEGSVRRAGDRVRITAQLIDARTDEHLWAESYDRELEDVFQIQSEIAQEIARALEVRLTRDERERIAAAPTSNLTAYDYYRQGRQYLDRYTQADIERSVALFERAVALDSGFALAYAWLARARMTTWTPTPVDSAAALARRAIALDPGLPDGYAALAEWYRRQGRYSLALEQYRRAVALNPSDATATAETGQTYGDMGRLDEAIPWLKRAVSLDPRTVWPYEYIGFGYALLGKLDEAERWYRRGLELQPDYAFLHVRLADLALRRGDLAGAGGHARTAVALDSVHQSMLGRLDLRRGDLRAALAHHERAVALAGGEHYDATPGYLYRKLGERRKAEEVFREVERRARRMLAEKNESFWPYYALAATDAARGRKEQALHDLDQAVARGYRDVWGLSNGQVFAELRGERRFQEIAARMRAEAERQRLRVEREGL
ncbi:MAG TPA: tetratricopeptide repeat protein [Longimicrobium sp.]|jgi:TolB-like protein/Tfp pilus assembly protein PilF